jgi:cyclic pyranopterin phosphate synthase
MEELADKKNNPDSLYGNLDRIYLRVSLTDSCNFRCQYCMPAEAGHEKSLKNLVANDEELLQLINFISEVRPLHKIRLTGGEPLLRKSIVTLSEKIKRAHPESHLCLTTNGVLLARYAEQLFTAGMESINISLDSVDQVDFKNIARADKMAATIEGIEKAVATGFKLKLNTVLIKSALKGRKLADLVEFAAQRNLELRFIELMPIGEGAKMFKREYVDSESILKRLRLEYTQKTVLKAGATSKRYLLKTPAGKTVTVGFIQTTSEPFCDRCDRMRIDSRGNLFSCLRSVEGNSLLDLLRAGQVDLLQQRIKESLQSKVVPEESWPEYRSMVAIGG